MNPKKNHFLPHVCFLHINTQKILILVALSFEAYEKQLFYHIWSSLQGTSFWLNSHYKKTDFAANFI